MRVGGLQVIGHLDVGQFRAADRLLLFLHSERVPSHEIVEVLLDDDIAPSGKVGVLLAHDGRGVGSRAGWILGAVDEPQ